MNPIALSILLGLTAGAANIAGGALLADRPVGLRQIGCGLERQTRRIRLQAQLVRSQRLDRHTHTPRFGPAPDHPDLLILGQPAGLALRRTEYSKARAMRQGLVVTRVRPKPPSREAGG